MIDNYGTMGNVSIVSLTFNGDKGDAQNIALGVLESLIGARPNKLASQKGTNRLAPYMADLGNNEKAEPLLYLLQTGELPNYNGRMTEMGLDQTPIFSGAQAYSGGIGGGSYSGGGKSYASKGVSSSKGSSSGKSSSGGSSGGKN